MVCIYAYIAIHTLAPTNYTIYIYIVQDPIHHAQATGAAGSCSQHDRTTQQSPPEATVDFY